MRRIAMVPALLAVLVGAPPAHAWTRPVDGPVLKPFSLGEDAYAAGYHRGVDLAAPAGSPIRAPASGTVTFAGVVPDGGRTITIATPDGFAVTLVHLGSFAAARGAAVAEGSVVATVGPSGVAEHPEPYVPLRRAGRVRARGLPRPDVPARHGERDPGGSGRARGSPAGAGET
jgi:murein DD-endopeptidase MepM/ murein hydrolase activator NlpD